MRVQIEGRVGRQLQLNSAGTGVHIPGPGGAAFGLNVSAARLGLQGSLNSVQLHASGAGVHPHRARRGLLQSDASAAGVGFKSAGDITGVNRSASGLGVYVAFYPVDIDIAGAGFGLDPIADGGNLQPSGTGADLERAANTIYLLVPRTALDPQIGFRRHHHLVADGNVAPQFGIFNAADVNIIAVLLDGRVRLDPFYLFSGISAKLFAGPDASGNLHLTRRAGTHLYAA